MNNNNTSSWWLLSRAQVLKVLYTDPKEGLTQNEAQKRLLSVGPNTIVEAVASSAMKLFLNQFASVIVLVLIAACSIAVILGAWVDAIVIAVIVLLNALIGFYQEYAAEQSLAALKRMTKPLARVVREGKDYDISSSDLVPGDVIILKAGDVVPADGRIIESHELGIEEASLTGESVPVTKSDTILIKDSYGVGDLKNMAFMGTLVVKGRGFMVVTETGTQTEFGKIAQMMAQSSEKETNLQKQLKQVGSVLIVSSCVIAAIVIGIGFLQGIPLLVLLFTCLSLFIAAVPEGLPVVITIALAQGVKRMASRQVLIRRLASVEALGSISFICTDKTGTITENRMVVTDMYAGGAFYKVSGTGLIPEGTFTLGDAVKNPQQEDNLAMLLKIGVLCNSAHLEQQDTSWVLDGDPTEGALLMAAAKADLYKDELEKQYPLLHENPFDSARQSMSTLRRLPQGVRLFVKGAGDVLLTNATHKIHNGIIVPLTQEGRAELERINSDYAQKALRVIALAYKDRPEDTFNNDTTDETGLVFVGFMAMMDPPRKEVRQALSRAQNAGIRTIMLTGDHKETARAIANGVGLITNSGDVLTGKELDILTDEKLLEALYSVPVYARISAEHKMRIVTLLKKAGERVAMTGDGVNDAPALKMADMGIAMGITGTDVAKEAADMIITDDNYASIIAAIEEGRGLYESLVKFLRYMLPTNLAELLVILWGTLFKFVGMKALPLVTLLPVQLLWINLVTDGIPAIALVFDPLHKGLMDKNPEAFSESLVSTRHLKDLFLVALLISIGVMLAYCYGITYSPQVGQTMAFTALVLLTYIQLFAVRSQFKLSFFSNPFVLVAIGVSLLLQMLLIYVPVLQRLFHTVPLEVIHWQGILGITIGICLVYSLFKKLF